MINRAHRNWLDEITFGGNAGGRGSTGKRDSSNGGEEHRRSIRERRRREGRGFYPPRIGIEGIKVGGTGMRGDRGGEE